MSDRHDGLMTSKMIWDAALKYLQPDKIGILSEGDIDFMRWLAPNNTKNIETGDE